MAAITGRHEKGCFKVCREQWDWREPLSISDSKNPLKVLRDLKRKKYRGFCACRREAVPGETSE